jgi:drug/metabolite transporter (DMT)-like permease
MPESRLRRLAPAIAAPILFGAGVAASKVLLGKTDALLLAGGLYLGSGIGLGAWSLSHRLMGHAAAEAPLKKEDTPWLIGSVIMGGVIGPSLLMLGLRVIPANSAALLLNLEAVFTALLAGLFFSEHLGLRSSLGIALVIVGSAILSWTGGTWSGVSWGGLALAGACLSWAVDNNLAQRISSKDPVQIAAIKGLVAGSFNTALALILGAKMPGAHAVSAIGCVGLLSYGVSLVCFMKSLRTIGTARTGMYFALAPFIGAAIGLIFLREPLTMRLVTAAALMGSGIWLSLNEHHEHAHTHSQEHEHLHVHDEHHLHEHSPDIPWAVEHSHFHSHAGLTHTHRHDPDIHHREGH